MKSKIIKISIIALLLVGMHVPAQALSGIVAYSKRAASLAKAHPRKTACLIAASTVLGNYVGSWWSKRRVEKAQIAFNQALTAQQEFFKKYKLVIEGLDRNRKAIAQFHFDFNEANGMFIMTYYGLESALKQQFDPWAVRLAGRSVPADFALVKKYKPLLDDIHAEDQRCYEASRDIIIRATDEEPSKELVQAAFDRVRAHMKVFEKHGLLPQEGK